MKRKNILYIFTSVSLLTPIISFAALDGLESLLKSMANLINLTFPVLIGLSTIFFFWGVAQFILHEAGNDKTREDGKKKMLWGIIALFVMVSIFGILNWIGDAVGIDVGGSSNLIQFQFQGEETSGSTNG
jgi:hypothetical protein